MKTLTSGLLFLEILILSNTAFAGVECITTVANSVTTPDYGCYRSCGDHANRVPLQTLVLDMDKKFKDMGAFFRNGKSACTGGSPCGFSNIPPVAAISSDGTKATLIFKTWSLPVSVTLSAEICIYNASTPPTPAVEATPPKPSSSTAPPPSTTVNKLPIPPEKVHEIEEAGALANHCDRLKDNWNVQATVYCRPHSLNISEVSLRCSQRPDGLFRKVSGIVRCTQ